VCLSAANTHDSMLLEAVVDAVPPVKGHADGRVGRASAPPSCTWTRPTTTRAAARRCVGAGSCPGSPRVAWSPASGWAATGTWSSVHSPSWLVRHRRLQAPDQRRGDILLGFVYLAGALICLKQLPSARCYGWLPGLGAVVR
jgi:hypothetical protein